MANGAGKLYLATRKQQLYTHREQSHLAQEADGLSDTVPLLSEGEYN